MLLYEISAAQNRKQFCLAADGPRSNGTRVQAGEVAGNFKLIFDPGHELNPDPDKEVLFDLVSPVLSQKISGVLLGPILQSAAAGADVGETTFFVA